MTITDETGQTVRGASAYGNAYAFMGRYWDADCSTIDPGGPTGDNAALALHLGGRIRSAAAVVRHGRCAVAPGKRGEVECPTSPGWPPIAAR